MLYQANHVDQSKLLERCNHHSIQQVCTLLSLNRSSIYRHKRVQPKQAYERDQSIVDRVCAIFKMSGQNYGSRRIQRALQAENIMIGRYKVRRIMRQHGLKTTWTRAFIKTTDSKHKMKVADNVLNQQFNPDHPNYAWVADMTYIWTASGWLYLATVMDLYSRKIVGYSLSSRMAADLVCTALQVAIHTRVLILAKIKDISYYITMFYNQVRLHSKLGYLSPNKFEQINNNISMRVSDFT